jgi:diguanylate cyclase (GGDEF)-like protein/PAS domain S-box-containing protein
MEKNFSIELLLDNLPGMVYRCKLDADWTMEYMSPWVKELTGYSVEDLLLNNKLSFADLYLPEDKDYVAKEVQKAVDEFRPFTITYRILDAAGRLKWVWEQGQAVYGENNEVIALEGFITDITERKKIEARLEHLARHDTLTGLPNRAYLNAYLQNILDAVYQAEPVAVMFIDLDRFKEVNDTLGHDLGDMLLREAALRLKQCMSMDNIVARLGGDEFIVVAGCLHGQKSAEHIAEKILSELVRSFIIDGQEVFISASIGISMCPADGAGKEILFKNADIAMYRAKAAGRNTYRFFEPEMSEAALLRSRLAGSLHRAVERNEFELHFQPRMNLATMEMVGMEALIRWNHPELGRIMPLQFIPIAEECNLIESIGKWVLEEACRQTKRLIDRFNCPLRISVNLSAKQLKSPDLVDDVRQVLDKTGLPSHLLELELTESALIEDIDASAAILDQLHALGIMLAVDDFGTGYSSLAYLQRFPLNVLKLDRTFVNQNAEGERNIRFVKAFIDLAHAMELSVVGEGIEAQPIVNMLRRLSCDEGQGYYFSRPVTVQELESFIDKNVRRCLA